MTELEKAARQMVAVLEEYGTFPEKVLPALQAMRRALEQPAYRAVKTFHEGKPVYVAEQPARQEPLTDELNRKLESAAGLALEVLQKHRQMKGEYPMGMLGVRAVEEIEAAFREIDEAAHGIKGDA